MTVVPPTEDAIGKYLRENRLLNSLLVSLALVVGIIGAMLASSIVFPVGDESGSDFGDAGSPAHQQQQEKQKVVKLMQRQKKVMPKTRQTFRTTAISEISLPDFNELEVKDLAPVVDVVAPATSMAVSSNNQAMKSALGGMTLSLPKVMEQRCNPKKRLERLKKGGGHEMTEKAIIKGLAWLKEAQSSDGGWGQGSGASASLRRDAMSGMAILAFLGHCELQDSKEFGTAVKRGIDFLVSSAPDKLATYDENGKFIKLNGNSHQGGAYSHAIRTYALCEAYTMTKIPKLKEFALRAARVIIDGQNPNGGWAYHYGTSRNGSHVDLSVTGWCIQALKAAALTGIPEIEGLDDAMDKAIDYVKSCQNSSGMFQYMPNQHGGSSSRGSLTGTGVLCLQLWKENAKSKEVIQGLEYIIANRLHNDWSKVDAYEWYYHAQACFQSTGDLSTRYWKEWNKNFQRVVVGAQADDGHWPAGLRFIGDSDIFRTTMTILMLEVYYRFAPMNQV